MAHQWIAIIFIPLEKNLHVHSEKEGKHKEKCKYFEYFFLHLEKNINNILHSSFSSFHVAGHVNLHDCMDLRLYAVFAIFWIFNKNCMSWSFFSTYVRRNNHKND